MVKSYLKKEYSKAFKYLWKSGRFILFVFGIFLLISLAAYFIPTPKYFSDQILEYISNLLDQTKGMGFSELGIFIFLNNLKSSFFGLIFGILFGVFPIISAVGNGYILGFVARQSVIENGVFVLWRIVPHGIFELPAVFISLGLGVKLGTFFLKEEKSKFLKENFKSSIRVFLLIVIPLLIIAALIETFLIFFTG